MRQIIWSDTFSTGVEALGGAEAIDHALEPIIESLTRNPYGFEKIENDWTSFRVIRTKAIGFQVPALVIVFVIDEDKNVVLEWVDEDLPF